MEASVLDFRKNMTKIMSAIDRRERVTLTHRGRRRAIILPISEKKKVKVSELPAFGLWAERDDMQDPVAYVEKLREPRNK